MSGAGINEVIKEMHVGDYLSAANFNNIAAFVNRGSQVDHSGGFIASGCGVFPKQKRDVPLIIYNGGAEAKIPAYGVVLRNGVTTDSQPVSSVKRPNVYGCQSNFFVNKQSPIAANVYGEAQWGWGNLFIAAYDSADGTPANGESWGPRNATYLLKKNTGGFVIEGIYDATNHYALVRSVPMLMFMGQCTSALTVATSSPTMTVFTGSPGSEATTSQTLTAYLRRGIIYKNKSYEVRYLNGNWEIDNPTLAGDGKCVGAVAKGSTGTVNIFQESSIGDQADSGVTLQGYNRWSAIAAGNQVRWEWNNDSNAFIITAQTCPT